MSKVNRLRYHLEKANLYFLLAKKYEYVDPAKHFYFYRKHFYYTNKVEQDYMMMHSHHKNPGHHYMNPDGSYDSPDSPDYNYNS